MNTMAYKQKKSGWPFYFKNSLGQLNKLREKKSVIKVMSFNIHHGKGKDKQVNLNRIAEVIDLCNADIIGLNEVDSRFSKRSLYQDQAAWLANRFKMDYSFCPSISRSSNRSTGMREYGNALLSRFPIIRKEFHSFHKIYGMEGRSFLDATIRVDQRPIHINVTHLSLNPILHKKQINFILSHHHKKSDPIILLGDWNMKPGSKGWEKITDKFQDAWAIGGKGAGCTYPSLRPRLRLDYIFASDHFMITDAKVMSKIPIASDHLPVTATLFLKE